jgi:uncharacterized protein
VNALSRALLVLISLASTGATAPPPAAPPEDAIVPRVRALLIDANATWSQQFKSLGSQYPAPEVAFFRQTVRKACGSDIALTGSFYCPDERKIYFDLAAGLPMRARWPT